MQKPWLSKREEEERSLKTFVLAIKTNLGWGTFIIKAKNIFGTRPDIRKFKNQVNDYTVWQSLLSQQ